MHIKYMKEALIEARKAYELDEVPVGAIIVYQDQIIARAHNTRENTNDPTHHAEILAIQEASQYLNTWKLDGCTLYVSLEPCMMCTGAIVQSRIDRVVYGASDEQSDNIISIDNISAIKGLNHYPEIIKGVLEEEASKILIEYFRNKRKEMVQIRQITKQEDFDAAMKLRYKVFVDEQKVDPDIEYDEYDNLSRDDVIHLIAKIDDIAIGTLRMILIDDHIKVGRVAVAKDYRKQKIGYKLMDKVDKYACNSGYKYLELGAQLSAMPFYERCGYTAYGDIFLDAEIEHKMMKKECE